MYSAKSLLFLIIGTFFLKCRSQEKQIRGAPEVDYPTYYLIPKTSFRCSEQLYNPGFYADTETRCQVFHYCYEHRQESFLCPMGTIFNQPLLTCDYWYSSNCSLAPSYYHVNAKRNEDFVDEADEPQDVQSENLYDKMAHLYEINKTPEQLDWKNDSGIAENDLFNKDSIDSSDSSPLIEKNNKTVDYNKYSYDNQFNMADEKHPEIVKYEVVGLNAVKVHKGSDHEPLYDTENSEDFILSEDGMLHPSQEDVYQLYPTDMNFNQGYSGYAEIPSEDIMNDNLNGEYESNFQISSSELQRRYSNVNENNVRRPFSRKPIIILPEEEPEIVPLPVMKHKRKRIEIPSTTSVNANGGSSYETTHDSNIHKEVTASFANENLGGPDPFANENFGGGPDPFANDNFGGTADPFANDNFGGGPDPFANDNFGGGPDPFANDNFGGGPDPFANENFGGTASIKFKKNVLNPNIDYEFNDPKLFYEILKPVHEESDLHLHQTETSSVVYDYSNKKNTRNAYVLSNSDEGEISSIFGLLSNDVSSISNTEQRNTSTDSNLGNKSDIFIENSTALLDESSETAADDSFDINPFLESGSEENTIQFHSNDESSFVKDQDIFSDSEGMETINKEISYVLPMNLSDTFEGSGISVQETDDMHNFVEVEEPTELNLKDDSDDTNGYNKESGFPLQTFDEFSPSETPEHNEGTELVPDGSGGESSEFNYLSHELQESSDILHDTSDEMVPEIQETDGSYYYVFPDSEYHSTSEHEDSNEFYSGNGDYASTENFEISSDKFPEELIDNTESHYSPIDSELKTDNTEKLSGEFEAETSSNIPEYIVDDLDSTGQLSTEDLKFLEIMSQTPIPMPMNLFDVSNEKSRSEVVKDEIPHIEILPLGQDTDDQAATHEGSDNMEDVDEIENFSSNISPDIEKHLVEVESSEINPEVLEAEQKAVEDGSGEEKSEIFLSEQNLEALTPGKEIDPFHPLFAEGSEIFASPNSRKKSSLNANPVKPKGTVVNSAAEKDLKKVTRGKRWNENLRTFNPSGKGNPLRAPSRETFRETVFSSIPTTFLKMKHSTLRPYFYNYDLKNSGFNPRTGDLFESSKLSKLASLGKKILAAKRSKFSRFKKYIDSYRNN